MPQQIDPKSLKKRCKNQRFSAFSAFPRLWALSRHSPDSGRYLAVAQKLPGGYQIPLKAEKAENNPENNFPAPRGAQKFYLCITNLLRGVPLPGIIPVITPKPNAPSTNSAANFVKRLETLSLSRRGLKGVPEKRIK